MRIAVFSCVGGGPMERLADHLRARGQDAVLVTELSAMHWRKLVAAGPRGRLRARLRAMVKFPLKAVAASLTLKDAVLVPTTNPFFVPAILVATKAVHGRPVVPLVYDLYPDAAEASGHATISPLAARLAEALNQFLFAYADGVAFIGDRMAAHATGRYGKPRATAVLHTGASLTEFDGSTRAEDIESVCGVDVVGKTVLSYVGNLGHVHDWETLRDGLVQLCRSDARDVAVIISASGPGVEFLKREIEPNDVVHFVSPTDDVEWRRLMVRTDIALVTLRDAAKHTSVPSKTFSAMAAGSAVIAIAPRGSDLADVVTSSDCGVLVSPGNGLHFLDAMLRLVRDSDELARLRQNARTSVAERYDLDGLAERWQTFATDIARHNRPGVGYGALKRLFDITASAGAIALLSPLLAGTAVAVGASMGRPVLFRQKRPGRGGVPFELYKFRSMRAAKPDEVGPEHDAARLTRTGELIRKLSLDELPALFNVLAGEMSLVGPRPLLLRYLARYSRRQARRHEVTPGITGQAQVNGRNAIGWDEKLEHDVWYVDNRSLLLDLKILLQTVTSVLRRSGISQAGHATMPEFMGPASADDQTKRNQEQGL